MAKKKAKKKVKRAVKAKKAVRKVKAKKGIRKMKAKAPAKIREKLIGKIEHYFDKISVAAISVKAPFKVGDVIHIKGHTTDFYQRVDSMQIEHQNVMKVKKGDDIGIKVKEFVRGHDLVYLGTEKDLLARPVEAKAPPKSAFQTSIFKEEKPLIKPPVMTTALPSGAPKPGALPPAKPPAAAPKAEKKTDPYSETKFFNF